jgi:hypothetical protein
MRETMNSVTFVILRKSSPDGRYPFMVLRISGSRQEPISYHKSLDDATDAANRYAAEARFAQLDARVFHRDWLVSGAPKGTRSNRS